MFLMRSPMGNGILDGSSMMMSKLGGRETSYTSHASNIKPLKYYATQILPFSSRFDPQFVFIDLNSAHSRSFEINQPQNYMESSLDVGWMKGTFIYNYPHPFLSLSPISWFMVCGVYVNIGAFVKTNPLKGRGAIIPVRLHFANLGSPMLFPDSYCPKTTTYML